MKKFIAFMEEYVVPVAAKIGAEPHLAAIRDGFVTIIPIIMMGAFGILVNNITNWHVYVNFMSGVFGPGWKGWGGNVWNASYGIMSLLVCFTIAYHFARSKGKDGLAAAVVSVGVLVLFIVNIGSAQNVGFLGTDGLLLGIVVALVASHIMCLLMGNPRLLIKMPDGVPPAVARSFASLFPTMIVVGGAGILQELYLKCHTGMILPALFNKWIQTPLQGVVSSLWGVLILILVIHILWFFGLHGSNMMLPVVQAVLFPLTIANMQAIEHGEKAK
ncbi:PTS transporter subunit EIIC, partial [uncultured Clostridium sp.]|uniref:PTS transporter subunit EIIC n=1 Tax=uncultured Clostridium sp. TaxID=59620 RepID=UPI00260F8CE0